MYKPLDRSEEFYGVYADVGGFGIVWNDDIDLSCDELWDNGVIVNTPFNGLLAFCEAAKSWELDESELRVAVSREKLISGADACGFGGRDDGSHETRIRGHAAPCQFVTHPKRRRRGNAGNTVFLAFLSDVKIPFMYCVLSRRML
ncbi:MAG: DUF2442 domain-containing protein [Clostridia bacterium]|nr:DUF2442 domain-containing protein [Clostridia bacterium]